MVNALYLDNWTVERFENANGRMTVWASYDLAPEACERCGVVGRLYVHGTVEIDYADAPLFGWPSRISVKVRRYRCRDCGKTFMQPLPDMQPNRQMTRRSVDFIERQTGNQTWTATAKQLGIDEKTIREITADQIAGVDRLFRPYAPRILGIDELKLDGELRVMLVDIDRKQPIDLLPKFNKATIVHWLMWLPNRENIQLVAMDMSETFFSAVSAALPGVPIVADRFHVVRAASGALNSIRIAKGKAARTKAAKKEAFKGRHMLLKRPSNLTAEQAFKLDGLLKNNADLNAAYEAKEAYFRIWDEPDRAAAKKAIAAWLEAVPPQHATAFEKASRALIEWEAEILAFWGEQRGISNAYTESANGMTKINNRAGRGYGFDVIRARVLLDLRTVNPYDWVRCEGDRCGITSRLVCWSARRLIRVVVDAIGATSSSVRIAP